MAASTRPAGGLTRRDRLDQIREQMPEHDTGPTIADEILDRHEDAGERARVTSWFIAATDPDCPEAVTVCCRVHGLRRAYAWLKASNADDLDQIEQLHTCSPTDSLVSI